jgi:hypothetical protein
VPSMSKKRRLMAGLTILFFSGSLIAQNKPSIVVGDIDVHGISLAEKIKLKNTISEQLFNTHAFGRVINKSLQSLAAKQKKAPAAEEKNLTVAKSLLGDGESMVKERKWSEAIEKLDAAILHFEESPALFEEVESYIKALVFLAHAYANKNIEIRLIEVFRKIIQIYPGYTLPAWFSENHISLFKGVEKKLSESKKGNLKISVSPNDSELYLCGRKINSERVKNGLSLIPGEYTLIVRRDGYGEELTKVAIREGEKKNLTIQLKSADSEGPNYFSVTKSIALLPHRRFEFLQTVNRDSQAEYVLLVSLELSGGNIVMAEQMIAPGSSELSKIVSIKTKKSKLTNEINLLAYTLANCLNENGHLEDNCRQSEEDIYLSVASPETIQMMTGEASSLMVGDDLIGKWWFSTILGGVLVAGLAAGVLILTGGDNKATAETP